MLLLQARPPQTITDMILGGTWPTRVVLLVLAFFSVVSLWVMIAKIRHFRAVRREGDRFLNGMENASSLDEAHQAVLTLPASPYTRLFRGGLSFVKDLQPDRPVDGTPWRGLSRMQLEALRMVLDKIEAEEADEMSHGLNWLAVIGSVSPSSGPHGDGHRHHEYFPRDHGVGVDQHRRGCAGGGGSADHYGGGAGCRDPLRYGLQSLCFAPQLGHGRAGGVHQRVHRDAGAGAEGMTPL